jgi:predicted transcriptional regulator
MKTVRDILATKGSEVWWVQADSPVLEALEIMRDKDIGALLVKDAKRNIVGIFTERDYARKVVLLGKSSRVLKVGEVMTPAAQMLVARPDDKVEECMAVMTAKHIRHLPVIERQSLAGMISSRDLIEVALKASVDHIDNLNELCQTVFMHNFDDEIAGIRS